MKKKSLIIQFVIFFILAGAFIYFGTLKNNTSATNNSDKINSGQINIAEKPKAEKIEVFYFHSSARCVACITLEEYVRDAIEQYFQKEIRDGFVEFREINVDLAENKEIARKFQAVGSSLKINEIYDGEDHIEEDIKVWRYLSNKNSFENYLQERIKSRLK